MNKLTNINNIKNFHSEHFNWKQVQNEMKNRLGLEVYESWLKKISFVEEFNNYLLLSVPTRFIRDWITSRYLDQILQIVKIYKKNIIRIEFKIIEKDLNNSLKESTINNNKINENIALKSDFDYFMNFLKCELEEVGFLRPSDKSKNMFNNIQTMFLRSALSKSEIKTLWGMIKKLRNSRK